MLAVVEEGKVEQGTGEEDGLDETDEEASKQKTGVAVDGGHASTNNAPHSHSQIDVNAGPFDASKNHVGGHLHEDITDEENADAYGS